MGSRVVIEVIDPERAEPILKCLREKTPTFGERPGTSKLEADWDIDYPEAVTALKAALDECDSEWGQALRIVPTTQT
jgi:hypothetical protein